MATDEEKSHKRQELTFEIELTTIPLPEEHRHEWKSAMELLNKIILDVLDEHSGNEASSPVGNRGVITTEEAESDAVLQFCPDYGSYLHLQVDGKQTCRNEICPQYLQEVNPTHL